MDTLACRASLHCKRVILLAVLLLAGLTGFLWSSASSPALAHSLHAVLLRSDPAEGSVQAAPVTSVRLQFSEPVQLVGQAITVLTPSGASALRGPVLAQGGTLSVPIKATSPGTYLVTWQVISQDTAPVSGRFVFSVGRVSGVWASTTTESVSPLGLWLQVLARWLHFIGYALGFGALAFRQLVLHPLRIEHSATAEQRLWRLVTVGILALLLAEPLALFAQTASLGTGAFIDLNIIGDVLASSFGRVLAQRLGAAILLWVLIGIVKQGYDKAIPVALVLALGLAFIDGEASHAINASPVWLKLLANALHIAAMGVWVGGLAALLTTWRLKELSGLRSAIVIRFGQLAAACVAELIVTGTVMAWLQLARPSDLLTSAYGRVLTVKLIILLIALFLALIGSRIRQNKRERWWIVEAIVLTGILAIAGLLVSLPPPT